MNSLLPERTLQRFARNLRGRDFVVGDVHGHFELIERLLARVGFDEGVDRLFAAGDLVDRGPYSPRVVDWLQRPWFHSVRGNHEQLVIDVVLAGDDRDLHFRNGGQWLYQLPQDERERIARSLLDLPLAIEVEIGEGRRVGIVHAEAPVSPAFPDWDSGMAALAGEMGGAARKSAAALAMWARTRIEGEDDAEVPGLARLYVGHTAQVSVRRLGNTHYIDTGSGYSDGCLSLVDIVTGAVETAAAH
ncbi:metallophosphoesterase [Pseudomonas sp. ZM23]|uniref:Metallophosphoesterase n=1 Tax=Pseudomonas triclosanedens TaxID=2961893 RepID=A0ABY7A1D7_9PSED|nr:metallophosphoesterase [Pseudomonas triclosanedens]MCP8462759.1 metallophosphoesterase [Pseudomonas triclosanedens]MCP8468379.1 metallophosphoesterase [Pseudomonas triclosanedens]MCP8475138.1 metallophosphoesterase [Pseudomonas triclosanedens]WAI49944.1 metallophosphoesterase [Pseudomonas triclosanedens]